MAKEKWTVEFEIDPEDWNSYQIENDDSHVTNIEEEGITYWHYHIPTVLHPWKLIKREVIETQPRQA